MGHQATPMALIKPCRIDEFEKAKRLFYTGQLVPINESLYYVERILAFPFDLLGDSTLNVFFAHVVTVFRDSILMGVSRLADDNERGAISLPQFRNRLYNMIKSQCVDQYRQYLKAAKIDKRIEALVAKVRKIRNTTIAHANEAFWLKGDLIPIVSLEETQEIVAALNELCANLFFEPYDTQAMMLIPQHSKNVTLPPGSKPDIERLLDMVASSSPLLRMPDEYPERWYHQKTVLGESQLRTLDDYRRKLGLGGII